MISISYFTTRLVSPALALNLLIVIMSATIMAAVTISPAPLVQNAFADHGQEIVLTSKDASFAPVSSGEGGNQVKVVVNYAVHDPMIANDLVKGVMKVYSPDGTLLKTSSSPTPFPISNSNGTATLATTLTDPTIESVTAKIVFTNPIKTEALSNELTVSGDLIRGATLSGEQKEMTTQQVLPKSESEGAPIEPLSEDKLSSTESAIASSSLKEEEQQPAELKEVPGIEEKKQIKSIESIPQTITNSSTMTTTTPALHIAEEICNDGIDNDSDTLIDFSDEECNPLQSQQQPILPQQQPILPQQQPILPQQQPILPQQQPILPQQQPILQQGQTMVSTSEICDDDLDNDFDGRVDSRDEECSSITSTSSFSPPIQEQSVTDEQTEGEDEDTEHQSDEDVSEEPGKNEDGDSEDDKEEDEDTEHQSDDEESHLNVAFP
ncbi:MAG TPA: hypothetical protein VFS97_03300 [Nitrososphaeraceae archaeon]|nr:hypothetical protein [Nitrososphaeraceae archaeon]